MLLFGRQADVLLRARGAGEGRTLRGLRVVFNVTKSNDPTANSAEVIVYNMSQQSIAFAKQPNMGLVLSAGYDGGDASNPQLKVIFSGDIFRQSSTKQGGDVLTKFENSDSIRALQNAQINRSYKSGTPVSALLNEAISSLGIARGKITGIDGKQFVNGYSAVGLARDQLDVIAAKTDTIWSIQDGAIQFIPVRGSTDESVVYLSNETGLVGSPNQKMVKVGALEVPGVEAVSLLQPEIKPGRRVQITSNNVKGIYTVQKVQFRGDTRNGPWYAELEAV